MVWWTLLCDADGSAVGRIPHITHDFSLPGAKGYIGFEAWRFLCAFSLENALGRGKDVQELVHTFVIQLRFPGSGFFMEKMRHNSRKYTQDRAFTPL